MMSKGFSDVHLREVAFTIGTECPFTPTMFDWPTAPMSSICCPSAVGFAMVADGAWEEHRWSAFLVKGLACRATFFAFASFSSAVRGRLLRCRGQFWWVRNSSGLWVLPRHCNFRSFLVAPTNYAYDGPSPTKRMRSSSTNELEHMVNNQLCDIDTPHSFLNSVVDSCSQAFQKKKVRCKRKRIFFTVASRFRDHHRCTSLGHRSSLWSWLTAVRVAWRAQQDKSNDDNTSSCHSHSVFHIALIPLKPNDAGAQMLLDGECNNVGCLRQIGNPTYLAWLYNQ